MEPTVALPLHFTIETAVLTAAALLIAWAALRRQWLAALSAIALSVGQALHAGHTLDGEDDPLLVALRAIGVVGLAVTVLPREGQRALFGSGLVGLSAGTIWGALEGGGTADFSAPPHVLLLAGGLALLVWVVYATRASVRLRVVTAFVGVLAMAVVVAGGAIARVAALDSRSDQYRQLNVLAVATERQVRTIGEEMRHPASNATAIAAGFQRGRPSLDALQVGRFEWAVLLGRDGAGLDKKAGADVVVPYTRAEVLSLDIVKQARAGTLVSISFATAVEPQGLIIVTAAPVYRPTEPVSPSSLLGVLVLGRTVPPSELRSIVPGRAAQVAVRGEVHAVSSDTRLPKSFPAPSPDDPFLTIEVGDDTWLAATVPLPGGNVDALLASPDDAVVAAATRLVRSFLVAILAAALLAVIAALWLSARITRPLLELADEAERVKTDFLSSLSHELRTPLTPIRGYTELLRRGVPARSRPGYLDEIGAATQRMERIVSLLVDVAAMDAGRYQIAEENTSVRGLFEEATQRWGELGRRIAMSLPKGELTVRADPRAIARVLDELIDNAFKFAPDTKVELAARRAARGVEISVRDEGPGIDPERLAGLKAPFATGERGGDTKRYGGLGLGLSFVEGVLGAHGARLTIDSEPGRGTTCAFTLRAAGSVTAMPARMGRVGPPSDKPASPKR